MGCAYLLVPPPLARPHLIVDVLHLPSASFLDRTRLVYGTVLQSGVVQELSNAGDGIPDPEIRSLGPRFAVLIEQVAGDLDGMMEEFRTRRQGLDCFKEGALVAIRGASPFTGLHSSVSAGWSTTSI